MTNNPSISKQCEYDLDAAIGGAYVMEDGRTFWVDHATVREITSRIRPIIGAECERHYLNGTRNPNTVSKAGGA
jgi:hypothetical protein